MKRLVFNEVVHTLDAILLGLAILLHIAVGFSGLFWAMVITTILVGMSIASFLTRVFRRNQTIFANEWRRI